MNRSKEEFFHFYFQMPVKYQLKAAEGEQHYITSNLFPSLTLNRYNKYYSIKKLVTEVFLSRRYLVEELLRG